MASNEEWSDDPHVAELVDQAQRMQRGFSQAEVTGESFSAAFRWEARVSASLQALRRDIGYSQAEVVERLKLWGFDMHQTTLAKLESGKRPIRLAELYALASIYRITPGTILFDAPAVIDGSQDIDEQIAKFEEESARLRDDYLTYTESVFDLLRAQADNRAGLVNVLKAFARSNKGETNGLDQTEA